ncbi:hypothetical protein [Thermoactinomyces mirandus]|uniref:hypothetical protein n=1 Tax=Thermoactinomyces mirandus TaxID=2756294 RepID=UPI00406D1912
MKQKNRLLGGFLCSSTRFAVVGGAVVFNRTALAFSLFADSESPVNCPTGISEDQTAQQEVHNHLPVPPLSID